MIPDRLQYFLEHFRNDQKCNKILTLGPHFYHQKHFKIDETRLESNREAILDKSGSSFYYGNLEFGPCWSILDLSAVISEIMDLEKQIFKIDSSGSYNLLKRPTG